MNAANTDSDDGILTPSVAFEAFANTTAQRVDQTALMHVGGRNAVNRY